MHLFSMAVQ